MNIELKRWTMSDSKELTALCNAVDRSFLSDRLPNPYTIKDAEDWLCRVSQNEAVSGIYRAIIADEKVVGSISVEQKEDVYRVDGEISFMLHGDYCNKGIMTEVVRQMCTIAFRDLPIERITANIFQPNTASMQVLSKNGFVQPWMSVLSERPNVLTKATPNSMTILKTAFVKVEEISLLA